LTRRKGRKGKKEKGLRWKKNAKSDRSSSEKKEEKRGDGRGVVYLEKGEGEKKRGGAGKNLPLEKKRKGGGLRHLKDQGGPT